MHLDHDAGRLAAPLLHYLMQIRFGPGKFAELIRLPQYGDANALHEPYRGYGQPVFDGSGAKVADALAALCAGETFESVAEHYCVTEAQLRDAVDTIGA